MKKPLILTLALSLSIGLPAQPQIGERLPAPQASLANLETQNSQHIAQDESYPPEVWEWLTRDQVTSSCLLDPGLLDQLKGRYSAVTEENELRWMIVRHGKVCWPPKPTGESPIRDVPKSNESVAKTLTALILGTVDEICQKDPPSCDITNQESLIHKRIGTWLTRQDINNIVGSNLGITPHTRVEEILGMVAAYDRGHKSFNYQNSPVNLLGPIMAEIIEQSGQKPIPNKNHLCPTLQTYIDKHIFSELDLSSTWTVCTSDTEWTLYEGWSSPLSDMARLGLVLLREGSWNGKQLTSSQWVKDMLRPSFPEANCAYGYLTWLNATGTIWETLDTRETSLMDCAPTVRCGKGGVDNDFAVWEANGIGGQLIIGHKGLDMLIVTRNLGKGFETGRKLWKKIVPTIVAYDPAFCYPKDAETFCRNRNNRAFCRAYSNGRYASDFYSTASSREECRCH